MSKNDYLKECWQAANNDWQNAINGQKRGISLEIYIKDYALRSANDRNADNIADMLRKNADRAVKSKRMVDNVDYLAPIIADYRDKADKAESAYNSRIGELVSNDPDIKAGLLAITKLNENRAETLANMDKSSPNYSADLLVLDYHTRAAKNAIQKRLEAKTKEIAEADGEANQLWRDHCAYKETAEKLAKQPAARSPMVSFFN